MAERFDPREALEALSDHEVSFVLIGGVAGIVHGSPSVTADIDICYARDRANLERLAQALRSLNARLRNAPEDVPFLLDAQTLERGDHFTFITDAGPLDVLGAPAGSGGYDALARNAVRIELWGREVRVASLDDLIAMKLAAGRPKDRAEAEILGALRDVLDEEE